MKFFFNPDEFIKDLWVTIIPLGRQLSLKQIYLSALKLIITYRCNIFFHGICNTFNQQMSSFCVTYHNWLKKAREQIQKSVEMLQELFISTWFRNIYISQQSDTSQKNSCLGDKQNYSIVKQFISLLNTILFTNTVNLFPHCLYFCKVITQNSFVTNCTNTLVYILCIKIGTVRHSINTKSTRIPIFCQLHFDRITKNCQSHA